jgi:hypothetical protein
MSETPNPFRFAQLRNAFLSGFMLLAPFLVTCWVFFLVFKVIGGGFRDYLFFFLPSSLREQSSLSVVWNILATAIVVVLITVFGYVSRYVLGRYFGGLAARKTETSTPRSCWWNSPAKASTRLDFSPARRRARPRPASAGNYGRCSFPPRPTPPAAISCSSRKMRSSSWR